MIGLGSGTSFDPAQVGVGLVDTDTAEVIAGNAAYARVLERSPDAVAGVPVEAFLDPADAVVSRTVLTAMRDGLVDFLQGETKVHLPSGPATVYSWSSAVGAGPPRNAVIVGALPLECGGQGGPPPVDVDRIILGTLDDEWSFENVAVRSAGLLGGSPVGHERTCFREMVHPADHGTLAEAFDASAGDELATRQLRIRAHHSGWLNAQVTVSRMRGQASGLHAAVLCFDASSEPTNPAVERMNGLEERLWRIAMEVSAAGVLPPMAGLPTALGMANAGPLSSRQLDILARLAAGERAPAIAKAMHLSQSTVRNHLSALFRKFAVHSQAELLELLRHGDFDDAGGRHRTGG
ncbi:MAG TPA: helix-turn-helix transcriptional regulator [Acidimicrobiales bacterium]|nr:helix-turn-helix transcriptional regulator [Acidimicrobiales bacterium]